MEALIQGLGDDPSESAQKMLERVRESISQLPEREADFVELYYFLFKTQTEIAYLFRVSQPTVCYRLQRAARRIRFLLSLPTLSDDDLHKMGEDLNKVLKDPINDPKILIRMYHTSCQSVVAKEMGVSQGKIRHRLMRSIDILSRLKNRSEDFKKYYDLFVLIVEASNIRREVQRPSSGSKMRYILDCDPDPNISSFAVFEDEDLLLSEVGKASGEVSLVWREVQKLLVWAEVDMVWGDIQVQISAREQSEGSFEADFIAREVLGVVLGA